MSVVGLSLFLVFIVMIHLSRAFNFLSSSTVLRRRSSATIAVSSSSSSSSSSSKSSSVKNLVLYDGVCKFCNTWVGILLKLDARGMFKYAALQSEPGKVALKLCNRDPDDISSIVYIPDEVNIDGSSTVSTSSIPRTQTHYIKSKAVTEIVKDLGIPLGVVTNLLPLAFKDEIYDMVAENRYNLMGKYEECRLYDMEYEERFLK